MATKRIDYIDAIKGFSVLWVVLYHFDLEGVLVNLPLRLPLFFLVSGLFFRERTCFKDFFIKKVNTLLVPFAFFWLFGIIMQVIPQIFMYVWKGIFEFSLTDKLIGFCKLFTIIPVDDPEQNPLGVGAIWFLIGLFCLQMIYYACLQMSRNKLFLLVVSLVAYYLSHFLCDYLCGFGTLLYIPYTLRFLIFYVIGNMFCASFVEYTQTKLMKIKVGFILLPLFLIIIAFHHALPPKVELAYLGGVNNTLILIETILFAGIIIILFSLIHQWKIMKPFGYFGKNSIVIFGTHLALFPYVQIPISKFLSMDPHTWNAVLFEFPIIVACCFVLTELFVKYLPVYIGKKELITLPVTG